MHEKAKKQACEHKRTISQWTQGHAGPKRSSGTGGFCDI